MKATMNENGVIHLEPESPVEAYALRRWWADALVCGPEDEGALIKSEMLIISGEWPPKQEAK